MPRPGPGTNQICKQRDVLRLAEQRVYFSAGFVRETYSAEHSQGVHGASVCPRAVAEKMQARSARG